MSKVKIRKRLLHNIALKKKKIRELEHFYKLKSDLISSFGFKMAEEASQFERDIINSAKNEYNELYQQLTDEEKLLIEDGDLFE